MCFIQNMADKYIKKMNMWDFTLLKFCLVSIGMVIGMQVPESKYKKPILLVTFSVFLATYVPLMVKFVKVVCPFCGDDEITEDMLAED